MTGADLMALIKKQPVAFIAGLIFVACAAMFYLNMGDVADAQTRFEEKDTEAKKINENVRHAVGLAEQTAEMQELGKQFETRLVRAGQLATNLQFFYRLEAETGVKLLDIRQNPIPATVRPGTVKGAYAAVPFAMNIEGTYPQVLAFVRRIEAGPSFSRFANVTFSKAGARGEAGATDRMIVNLTVEMLGTP